MMLKTAAGAALAAGTKNAIANIATMPSAKILRSFMVIFSFSIVLSRFVMLVTQRFNMCVL